MALTPAERSLRGSIAANARWAQTEDRPAATLAARLALQEKFERQVDPDGKLTPAERAKRAANAQREHMQRMAYKSARARRRRGATNRDDSTGPGR
ncbi:hypothetical protein [Mycolicibacterium frederiksbergense]|uniref:hypothetical protein n=1 Tax=Mycolicibacterium frederiksbergense TaxID=117567 RepID=UPI00265BCCC2|nr:hypothetical protein [Mycolicibacterium frederiksbergense]MDO0976961.1 hypothetical protein [Mycolicibacterium frederiksbergense]